MNALEYIKLEDKARSEFERITALMSPEAIRVLQIGFSRVGKLVVPLRGRKLKDQTKESLTEVVNLENLLWHMLSKYIADPENNLKIHKFGGLTVGGSRLRIMFWGQYVDVSQNGTVLKFRGATRAAVAKGVAPSTYYEVDLAKDFSIDALAKWIKKHGVR